MSGIRQSDGGPNRSRPHASSSSSSSSPSSFLSAMEQLNQQYPPTQNQINSYLPLQPNVAVRQPLNGSEPSSSVNLAIPTTRSPPNVSHPPLQSHPAQTPQSSQYYLMLMTRQLRQVTENWEPHPLSGTEKEAERWGSQQRLAKVRKLEADQQRLLPQRDSHLEHQLFLARIDYRMRFCRTFRINDLPFEILGNIFRFVAWTAPNPDLGIRWRNTLTSVCRHWRIVALDDVTLWNVVWFRKFSQYELCFEYLERAGNSTLDVRLHDTQVEPLTLETTMSLIARLFTKLSNIRTLIIVVQNWDPALCFVHSLLRVGEQGIPMILERFELHRAGSAYVQVGSGYEPSFYIQPMALFGGAYLPSLRNLATNGVHVDWEKSVLVGLTTLDMRRMPLDKVPTLKRFRAILQKCPTLYRLVLDGAGPQWPASLQAIVDLEPISLPHLKVLVLGDFSTDYGTYLCSQFIAPNVVELNLMLIAGHDPSSFFNQLAGKTSSIRTLTLHSTLEIIIPQAYAAIAKWLRSMPLLTYLRVINIPEDFLDLLLYDAKTLRPALHQATEDLICPKLAYLEFHYLPPVRNTSPNHISSWARSRAQSGFPLRKIFTGPETSNDFGQDQVNYLRNVLREVGSILHILSSPQKPFEEKQLFSS